MEELLLKLLEADNAKIQQGTIELREAFKSPECTPAMCQLIVSSSIPQVRQYAAVLLRKRYSRSKRWLKLPEGIRNEFKAVILQAFVNEQEKVVKNAIAQLLGVIAKHELSNNSWPEIVQFIQHLIKSENLNEKELGMYAMSMMTEVAPDTMSGTSSNSSVSIAYTLISLISETFTSLQSLDNPIAYYILKTLLHLVPAIKDNQFVINSYHQMMPLVMDTIKCFAMTNESKAVECMELLDELCENAVVVLVPHIKPLVDMCLVIGGNNSLDESLRVKAVSFIGWLVKTKKKAIVKHKLVEPIIDVLLSLMSIKTDDENEDVCLDSENEDNVLVTCATQTLDLLAIHLPPEKLIPYLIQYIEPAIQGNDIYMKRAAYLSIAVLAEGCSEYIRVKYLESFLRCICIGLRDPNPIVQNAALFATGQFSEHLQPEISQYSSELLPVLFDYLGQMCAYIKREKKEPPSVDRIFDTLEIFCQNLNKGLVPCLPTLMERLFEILNSDVPIRVRKLALSTISAAACACKEDMLPYFEQVMTILYKYLSEKPVEEIICLQAEAINTLGEFARNIGEQNFAPLATRSLKITMDMLMETDDPDLRKSAYGLFAAISTVMKKEMAGVLPQIVERMLISIRSSEGIVPLFKENENAAFPVYADLSENENEEEEDIEDTESEEDYDDDVAGYRVENSYLDEKESAILALREIAENTEEVYLPYLEESFETTSKLIIYPQEDMRKATIEALTQFCINFSKINTTEGKNALLNALFIFVPRLSEMIRMDDEPTVVITALDAYSELLTEIGQPVLEGLGHKDAIINCVKDVLKGQTQCQDQEEIEDDSEAEQDELLIASAGDVLSNFGKVISPDEFAICFRSMLPMFLEKLKKNKSEGQRSFIVGMIAECFAGLKHEVASFVSELLPILLKFTNDASADVRNNAFFGIGELALHDNDSVYPFYPDILQALSSAIAKETHAGTRDNIVGAIARLIVKNYSILPLDQVFPVFVNQLPLKEDFEENKTVFRSLLTLFQAGHIVIKPHISTLLKVAISVIHEKRTNDDEAKGLVLEFMRSVQRSFPKEWNSVLSEIPAEVSASIQQMLW